MSSVRLATIFRSLEDAISNNPKVICPDEVWNNFPDLSDISKFVNLTVNDKAKFLLIPNRE